jgi:uncharacterized protein (TIGR02391 family)
MSFQKTCGPCNGNGYYGSSNTSTCKVCGGLGELILEGSSSDYKTCGPCHGNGYYGSSSTSTCQICKGFGLNRRPSPSPAADRKQHDVFDWRLLHPEIISVAKTRFESGHFADAVEAGFKEVNDRIKKLCKTATGKEYDGADLMWKAFSPKQPILLLGDLSTDTGKDMQQGYMEIFAGAIIGIRNPTNIAIDPERAIHFLFLASLLMFKVDEAKPSK